VTLPHLAKYRPRQIRIGFLLDDIDQMPHTVFQTRSLRDDLPSSLDYPIIAIADLHGQLDQSKRLVSRLRMVSE
jgi:hypothetical protein